MKFSQILILSFVLLAPPITPAQRNVAAERAWRPFFTAFRIAVKKRDRPTLRKMMSPDFFSSGGEDSGPEAAFRFWDHPEVCGWEAFDRVLAQGTVPNTAWPDVRSKRPSRVAPPIANNRRAIKREGFDWYAIFEFRGGRWYCIVFAQCCD